MATREASDVKADGMPERSSTRKRLRLERGIPRTDKNSDGRFDTWDKRRVSLADSKKMDSLVSGSVHDRVKDDCSCGTV